MIRKLAFIMMCSLLGLVAVAQCDQPQVSVTSTVESVCEGNAVTLQVSVFDASQNIPVPPVAVGDVLCTDNTIVKISAWPAAGKTASGIVCHVDNTGQHGWAISVQEQNQVWTWSTADPYVDVATLDNYTNARDAINDMNGHLNTIRIRLAGIATLYPAANSTDLNNDWYMPAAGQVNIMFSEMERLNTSLQLVGGTTISSSPNYWSSTEYGANYAWMVQFMGLLNAELKGGEARVRSVKDF